MSTDPASTIITKLGGPDAVATIAGVHLSRVYRWMAPKEAGGTGGTIPQRHHVALIVAARRQGVDLRADEFLSMEAAQ